MPVVEDVFTPRSPLTRAETGVRWKRVNKHILDKRAALDAILVPEAKRLGYLIGEGLSYQARVRDLKELMARLLVETYEFGIEEAQREIAAMRSGNPLPVEAIEQAHKGDAAPSKARARFDELADDSVDDVVAMAQAADAEPVAASNAAGSAMHNAVLNSVGMSMNLGRTQGALTAPGGPPTFSLRSEQLDKATCDACGTEHGEIYQVDSAEYYAHLPPSYCYGGGRCRGVMVFGDGPGDVRQEEPSGGFPMGPPGYVPKTPVAPSVVDDALRMEHGVRVVDPVPGPDVGIHAMSQSGLGNAETLANFRTATRDTGHFGTGTYFVSDASRLSRGSYAERDLVGIDLRNKNLYRPVDAHIAHTTHDALREINDLVASSSPLRTDAVGELRLQGIATNLPAGATSRMVRDAIEEARADIAAGNLTAETASTRVMRALGYDGIDVRHLPMLDNTTYGSVLYRELTAATRIDRAAGAGANAERDARIFVLMKQGRKVSEIARETGLSTTRIGRIQKELRTNAGRDNVIRELRRQGKSIREIADIVELSTTRVGRILSEKKIATAPRPPTAAPPRPPTPTGMNAKGVFGRIPNSSAWKAVDEGFKAVDEVLTLPETARGSVNAIAVRGRGSGRGSLGYFWARPSHGGGAELFLSRDLGPTAYYSKYANSVFVHEYGHLLDRMLLSDTSSWGGAYGQAFRDAVRRSNRWRSDLAHKPKGNYLSSDAEVWARAFMQWVALRSGNEALRAEVLRMRSSYEWRQWQWEDEDFHEIAAALDDIFRPYMRSGLAGRR